MAAGGQFEATIGPIADAGTWNERVQLIRAVPENFGLAQHPAIYAAIAERVYVPHLTPDFAYVHWREEYDLPAVVKAYTIWPTRCPAASPRSTWTRWPT